MRFLVLGLAFAPAALFAQTATSLPRAQFIAGMDSEFRRMDSDRNGQLTKVEIEAFQALQAAAQAAARNQAMFTQLDTDKNGQLSAKEFSKLAPPPVASNGQPMIARMDGNRDGQVSLIEHRTATVSNFDRLDTDKNGVVTAAEMKAGGIAPR